MNTFFDNVNKIFSIQEVSFHHPEQLGFKIKMEAVPVHRDSLIKKIHPGLLKESISVLSKDLRGGNAATRSLPHKKRILATISQQQVESAPKRSKRNASIGKPKKSSQSLLDPASPSIVADKKNVSQEFNSIVVTDGKLASIQDQRQLETSATKCSKRKANKIKPKKSSKLSVSPDSACIELKKENVPKEVNGIVESVSKLASIQDNQQQGETSATKYSKRRAGKSILKKFSQSSLVLPSISITENKENTPYEFKSTEDTDGNLLTLIQECQQQIETPATKCSKQNADKSEAKKSSQMMLMPASFGIERNKKNVTQETDELAPIQGDFDLVGQPNMFDILPERDLTEYLSSWI
mmetsp:Transcript_29342/g.45635  ORF Transcript_29342/g.45635 Transcript_29342/m.45635 type:complete len:353 (+) Transcript_29342:1266-2324(+)